MPAGHRGDAHSNKADPQDNGHSGLTYQQNPGIIGRFNPEKKLKYKDEAKYVSMLRIHSITGGAQIQGLSMPFCTIKRPKKTRAVQ